MCFSPEASFAVGGALLPAGVYCVRTAWLKKPRLMLIAMMPFAFGVQQIAEGFVWLGLYSGDAGQVRVASLFYLFFALAFWPWWLSMANVVLETRPAFKRFFIVSAVLTTVWFWVLHFPLVVGPESLLSIHVIHHSLHYEYHDLPIFQMFPRWGVLIVYFLSVAVPMSLGQNVFGRFPLVLLLASIVIARLMFEYAFISVWCFFAAILSGYLCVLLHRLPADSPAHPQTSAP